MNVRQITCEQRQKLEEYTCLGKPVFFKNKETRRRFVLGKVVDEISILSGDYKHVIQKIELAPGQSWDGSQYAFRSGYYTWDAPMKNVKWGQYHACLSEKERDERAVKAKEKGWAFF